MAEEFDYRRFNTVIPEFNGNKEGLQVFIRRCTVYHDSLAANARRTFLNNLLFKLSGRAFEIFDEREYEDWPAFRTALEAHGNRGTKPLTTLSAELANITQGSGSVEQFAERIRAILKEMAAVIAMTYEEAAVRNSFRNEHERAASRTLKEGLREPLKGRVIAGAITMGFEATVTLALQEEPYTTNVRTGPTEPKGSR